MDILKNFSVFIKTRIEFGFEISKSVGYETKYLGAKRILLVTDKNLLNLGILDEILKSLNKEKIEYIIFDDIAINAKDVNLDKGAEIFNDEKCELIIAVGGGSPIDAAKGISVLSSQGGKIKNYE